MRRLGSDLLFIAFATATFLSPNLMRLVNGEPAELTPISLTLLSALFSIVVFRDDNTRRRWPSSVHYTIVTLINTMILMCSICLYILIEYAASHGIVPSESRVSTTSYVLVLISVTNFLVRSALREPEDDSVYHREYSSGRILRAFVTTGAEVGIAVGLTALAWFVTDYSPEVPNHATVLALMVALVVIFHEHARHGKQSK